MKIIKSCFYSLPICLQRFLHQMKNRWAVSNGRLTGELERVLPMIISKYNVEPTAGNVDALRKDMTDSYVIGLKNKKNRREYLTDIEKDMYCNKYAGNRQFETLMDKWAFYSVMKPYYRREAMLLDSGTPSSSFLEFAQRHIKFIAKPNKGSFGMNTSIISVSDANDAQRVYDSLMNSKCHSWIIEELIVQTEDMSAFNPDSVNSVRIPTYRCNGKIEIFGCFMRTGRKGSVVDNAGVGGIFMKVDDDSGIICSDGFTEKGEQYEIHPDSKLRFKGFKIQRWNELKELAMKCHEELPQHKYVGWDFVLTDSGWVLMEGNWGQYLCQQVSGGKPLKSRFIHLIKN